MLFAGDLFEAIPLADQPTVIDGAEDEQGAAQHFVGEIAIGYGLLITPTCDMADEGEQEAAWRAFPSPRRGSGLPGRTGDGSSSILPTSR